MLNKISLESIGVVDIFAGASLIGIILVWGWILLIGLVHIRYLFDMTMHDKDYTYHHYLSQTHVWEHFFILCLMVILQYLMVFSFIHPHTDANLWDMYTRAFPTYLISWILISINFRVGKHLLQELKGCKL